MNELEHIENHQVNDTPLLNLLIDYLIAHDFPRESLALDFRLSETSRIDLAVIDKDTKLPIMFFEIKSPDEIEAPQQSAIKEDLSKKEAVLRNATPMYQVIPMNTPPGFSINEIEKSTETFHSLSHSPTLISAKLHNPKANGTLARLDFRSQRLSRITEQFNRAEEKKENAVDLFHIVCWALAALLALIGMSTRLYSIELRTADLTLLGAITGLMVAPFTKTIKFWGIVIERLTKSK